MKTIIDHIRQSLSTKLSLGIVLLTALVFVLALGMLFFQSRNDIRQEAQEHAISVLDATSHRVKSYLSTNETATNANYRIALRNMQPDSLLALTRRIVILNANVNGCSITTEPNTFPQYGRYFSVYSVRFGNDSISTVRESEYEYFDKTWYRTPLRLGEPCWVDPFDDYNEGTRSATDMIVSYCRPLYDNGHFVGVITTDLSLKRLSQIIATEEPYPNAYFLMLGQDGHYFVHPDSTRLVDKTIFDMHDVQSRTDIIALGHLMTSGKQGSLFTTIDGKPSLVCYQPVPGTNWSLALVCPESDMLHNYYKLSYVLIPLLVIGLLLIFLLSRHIVIGAVRPLNQLVSQSQRMAAGHYDEEIPHSPRPDAVGQLQNSFAAMQQSLNRHVNDIVRVNEETRQRNAELQEARQLAEEAGRQKTAFIQNMTHQIRTPLNIINGFAQVMRDNFNDLSATEHNKISDLMNHNAKTLWRMVTMLYDSSEIGLSEEQQSLRHDQVLCNELARDCIASVHQEYPDLPILFETTLPDTFFIRSNKLYLMRSLREILYNSAKYSDGGHITLQLSATAYTVKFVFSDTGPGIADHYQSLMFEPFTKINELSEGLGLGLPLSQRHITNLGGTLTLDTTYHDGCRFVLELPITSQA